MSELKTAKDLQGLWAGAQIDSAKPWHWMQISPQKMLSLIERIDAAETALAAANATIERLSAPVSNAEARECAADFHDGYGIRALTDFIAARAQEPK